MLPVALSLILALAGQIAAVVEVGAFSSSTHLARPRQQRQHSIADAPTRLHAAPRNSAKDVDVDEWTALTDDGGVKMRIISSGESTSSSQSAPVAGKDDVTVEYVGSILPYSAWTIDDVISSWLPDQGLSPLAPELFRAFNIDGTRLTSDKFSKKFVLEGLGVTKESKNQNLVSAAMALREYESSFPPGTVFDKNRFTFRLGKGMAVKAFDLALSDMRVGDTASVIARCDYAYGSKGVRSMGKVVVPPYAMVSFELTLVEIK